jgi:hypothetical protein
VKPWVVRLLCALGLAAVVGVVTVVEGIWRPAWPGGVATAAALVSYLLGRIAGSTTTRRSDVHPID